MRIWRVLVVVALAAVACTAGDIEVSTGPTPTSTGASATPTPTPTPGVDPIPAGEIATYEWRIDARFGEIDGNLRVRLAGGYDRDSGLAVMDIEVLVAGDDIDVEEAPTRPLTIVYRPDGLIATGLEPFWTEYLPADGGPLDPDAWYRVDEAIQSPLDPGFLEPMIEGAPAVFASLGNRSPQLRDAGVGLVGNIATRMQTTRLDADAVSRYADDEEDGLAALVETSDTDELIATVWVDEAGVVRQFVAMAADSRESQSRVEVELTGLNVALDVPDPATIEELARD